MLCPDCLSADTHRDFCPTADLSGLTLDEALTARLLAAHTGTPEDFVITLRTARRILRDSLSLLASPIQSLDSETDAARATAILNQAAALGGLAI